MDHRAHQQQVDAIEEEIDALIAEFGSARAAIRALLQDLTVLANDMNASTSRGYPPKSLSDKGRGAPGRFRLHRDVL